MKDSTSTSKSVASFALVLVAITSGTWFMAFAIKSAEMGWFEWTTTILFGAFSSLFMGLIIVLVRWFIANSVEDENIQRVSGVIVDLETGMAQGEYLWKASVEVSGEVHEFNLASEDFCQLHKGDLVIAYLRVRSFNGTSVEAIEKK